jgi:GDP-4-dehydro-6-deoxy-D-mannose reductase
MKKYIITGISGFVAFHFLEYLDSLNSGKIEVLGIDIKVPEALLNHNFINIHLRCIELNLLDYPVLEIALTAFFPDYIVHLASFSSVGKSWEDPVKSFINNTNIFLNIVEILRKNKIKCRFLSVGSSEEYGNVDETMLPLKESMHLFPVSPYAIARVSQEMLSQCYVVSYGVDIILTRSFNHIGPGQRDIFVVPSFVKQILEGVKAGNNKIILSTGDLSIVRDFIDVRDVVRAYYLLLEKGVSGELYNVCGGTGYALRDIIDMLAEIIKVNVAIETDNKKIRPNDNRIIIGDNSKIKSAVGWQPTIALRQSLHDLIDYWKRELGVY